MESLTAEEANLALTYSKHSDIPLECFDRLKQLIPVDQVRDETKLGCSTKLYNLFLGLEFVANQMRDTYGRPYQPIDGVDETETKHLLRNLKSAGIDDGAERIASEVLRLLREHFMQQRLEQERKLATARTAVWHNAEQTRRGYVALERQVTTKESRETAVNYANRASENLGLTGETAQQFSAALVELIYAELQINRTRPNLTLKPHMDTAQYENEVETRIFASHRREEAMQNLVSLLLEAHQTGQITLVAHNDAEPARERDTQLQSAALSCVTNIRQQITRELETSARSMQTAR